MASGLKVGAAAPTAPAPPPAPAARRPPVSALGLAKTLIVIMAGCIANNFVLEIIVSTKANAWADKGAGPLLTLLQFSLIVVANLPAVISCGGRGRSTGTGAAADAAPPRMLCRVGGCGWRRTHIPFIHYAAQTVLFFAMSYLNNVAFYFNISQPLHMVVRSANLVTTYVIGYAMFKRRYSLAQLGCVVALTLGAAAATFAEAFVGDTAKAAASAAGCASCANGVAGADATAAAAAAVANATATTNNGTNNSGGGEYMFMWYIGVGVLILVLVLQTFLGNYQNIMGERYGRAPEEAMFYMHLLSVPAFLFTLGDLRTHAALWSASPATSEVVAAWLEGGGTAPAHPLLANLVAAAAAPLARLPIMWTYAALNVVTQYCCIVGVYNLTPVADPLTVNVVLTVRKFLSLVLSIVAFNNTFTSAHWAGAVMVFGGALVYGVVPGAASPPPQPKKDDDAVEDATAADSATTTGTARFGAGGDAAAKPRGGRQPAPDAAAGAGGKPSRPRLPQADKRIKQM